eukprot:1553560-Prymnesium_polylepis.1
MILPPDTNPMQGSTATFFYQDPPDRPGLHRDILIFRAWAHKLLGELTIRTTPSPRGRGPTSRA